MPARQLEVFVNKGLQAGVGIAPRAVAKVLYQVASRNEKVPLRLPLSATALKLITAKIQGQLADLNTYSGLSTIDAGKAQFEV